MEEGDIRATSDGHQGVIRSPDIKGTSEGHQADIRDLRGDQREIMGTLRGHQGDIRGDQRDIRGTSRGHQGVNSLLVYVSSKLCCD